MFTIGADPEFMLTDKDCQLKSAIGILPKKTNNISAYYDNVLAEISIKPADNKKDFIHNTRIALKGLSKKINPLKFEVCASENYPLNELSDVDARIAGCNPEWDVYSLKCVLPPEYVIKKTCFRTAGGHIHLGSPILQDPINVFNTIRMMDLFIAIPSIFLDKDPTSIERRKIYGHAGYHRITDYGLEYRSLGNFWLSSPEHVALIYDLSEFVLDFVEKKHHEKFWSYNEETEEDDVSKAHKCFGYDVKSLIKCINFCDTRKSKKFMTFISHYLPEEILKNIDKLSLDKCHDPYCSWDL